MSGPVKETVNVTVPLNTDASGQTVYLAGNLSALGLGQSDWAANGIPMTRVSATKWTATIDSAANTTLSYKFDLGGSWNNVEKDADCADIGNRTMSVNGGTVSGCGYVGNRNFGFNTADATYTANDTVANWHGFGGC